jgi:DNA-binding transcriptional regulator YbjK
MPKIVDHEERRSRVAEAVCRLIARGGFEAVTLRAVAAEANSSLGAVQHYLKTRDDMLMAALQHIIAQRHHARREREPRARLA